MTRVPELDRALHSVLFLGGAHCVVESNVNYQVRVIIRVSQKNQKSEFCYATNPSGFHRLDEPPKKNSAL